MNQSSQSKIESTPNPLDEEDANEIGVHNYSVNKVDSSSMEVVRNSDNTSDAKIALTLNLYQYFLYYQTQKM